MNCHGRTITEVCYPKFHATFDLPNGFGKPGGPKFALPSTLSEAESKNYVKVSDCTTEPLK